jgi:hypothetical protein
MKTSTPKRARQDVAEDGEPIEVRAADQTAGPAGHALIRLAQLTPSPGRVDLVVLVRMILPQGKVTCRNGSLVSLCLVKLADDSDSAGSISLKLWRQRADWAVDQGMLQVGDLLLLTNAVVSQWRDAPMEVSMREGSHIRVLQCLLRQAAHTDASSAQDTVSHRAGPVAPATLETPPSGLKGLPVHVMERAVAVMAWAAAALPASNRRGRSQKALAKIDTRLQDQELLTCGCTEPPMWCGNVCGGACEWVRAGRHWSRERESSATKYNKDMCANGFHSLGENY